MKKAVLVMTLLMFAGTALAANVSIEANDVGDGWVAIKYDADANVSAFGLNISVDAGVIDDIADYFVGESNSTGRGFGIFLDKINGIKINDITGEVEDYGGPVADACAPGALGGLGTSGITIEMGALYEDGFAPDRSGTLCKVLVTQDCNLCVTVNPTRCGKTVGDANAGVVMEDGTSIAPDLTNGCVKIMIGCFPQGHPDYDEWVLVGKPDCWCFPRQCHADADGLMEGSDKEGYWYVGTNDLNVLLAGWKILEPNDGSPWPGGPGIASIPNGICADFAHDIEGSDKEGYWRVGTNDLNILLTNWKVLEPNDGNPWPGGPGVDPNCLDVP